MSYKSTSKPASNRPIDSKQERVIMEFLSKYLYAKAYPEHEIVEDRNLQLEGVDIAIPLPSGIEYHDAKAQASKLYINNPTQTFSMELLFDHNDSECVGWFLRPGLLTHVYALCWVNRAKVNAHGYIDNADDIEELEVMLLDKQELKGFINTYFYDEALYATAQKMRAQGTTRLFLNDAMYMVYSDKLNERPVNLVVKKWALEKCAYEHFKVRKDSVTSLM